MTSQAFGESFFDGVTEKIGKCYTRTYTAEELAGRDKQQVTAMSVKLYDQSYNFGEFGEGNSFKALKIQATVRGDKKVYGVVMSCNDSGMCGIDCDGPRTQLQWSTSTSGSIVIDARNENGNYISLDPFTCGDDENIEYANIALNGLAGGDDLFRLDPMPSHQCL